MGSVPELLELSSEEAALVEHRLTLADAVRRLRKEKRLTQVQLAELLGSSQSRIAKVEASPFRWTSSSARFSPWAPRQAILQRSSSSAPVRAPSNVAAAQRL